MRFTVSSSKHQELVDITDQVQELVTKSKIKNGLCNVFVTHATAAIVIIENADPNICTDFLNALNFYHLLTV